MYNLFIHLLLVFFPEFPSSRQILKMIIKVATLDEVGQIY